MAAKNKNDPSRPRLTEPEEQTLLQSLDKAVRDIDAGKGISIGVLRSRFASLKSEAKYDSAGLFSRNDLNK